MFEWLKKEIDIVIRHNPNHIRELKLTVSNEVSQLKADGEQLIGAFLAAKGLPAGELASQAFAAALRVIQEAFPDSQPVKTDEVVPAAPVVEEDHTPPNEDPDEVH